MIPQMEPNPYVNPDPLANISAHTADCNLIWFTYFWLMKYESEISENIDRALSFDTL